MPRKKKAKARKKKAARKPKDRTITERDKRYRANRRAAGFAQVRVFVPAADVQKIRDLAQFLREQAEVAVLGTGK